MRVHDALKSTLTDLSKNLQKGDLSKVGGFSAHVRSRDQQHVHFWTQFNIVGNGLLLPEEIDHWMTRLNDLRVRSKHWPNVIARFRHFGERLNHVDDRDGLDEFVHAAEMRTNFGQQNENDPKRAVADTLLRFVLTDP